MADWSSLPKNLLLLIVKRLETHFDILHIRSVCLTWRSSIPLSFRSPSFSLPLPLKMDENGKQLFLFKRTICLLEFVAKHNEETPHFLLVKFEEDKFGKKHILDPMDKLKSVKNPLVLDMSQVHVKELAHEFVVGSTDDRNGPRDKVAYLNANLDVDHHFMVLGQDLYLYKSGEEETRSKLDLKGWILDEFIQFKGKFYAVDKLGATSIFALCSGSSFSSVSKASLLQGGNKFFESCGNLLLIESTGQNRVFMRGYGDKFLREIAFEVFQLNEEMKRWVRLESLGDRIVFLGDYCNFSAAIPGVKGYCIVLNLVIRLTYQNGVRAIRKKGFVFDLNKRKIVPLNRRPDLLQLSPF